MANKPPSYRRRKDSDFAVVTLQDRITKKRREYPLGIYDSPESREQYHMLIAEWEKSGRRLPVVKRKEDQDVAVSVSLICLEF